MIPQTRAGYAAVVLMLLALALVGVEGGEYLARGMVDPGLRTLVQAVVVACVGALVYTVHLNGGPRGG